MLRMPFSALIRFGAEMSCIIRAEGRFVADCWFSDVPLPEAYTHPTAARLRETGGIQAKAPDREAIEAYLAAVDVRGAIRGITEGAKALRPGEERI